MIEPERGGLGKEYGQESTVKIIFVAALQQTNAEGQKTIFSDAVIGLARLDKIHSIKWRKFAHDH